MRRILPRDAFNDANLLKCIGKLTMLIEDGLIPWLSYSYDHEPFDIQQDESTGATFVANISFSDRGEINLLHERPLNSRAEWPLYFIYEDNSYPVFNESGEFILTKEELLAP